MIELFFSANSPYVRKVMVCAHELGVADKVALLDSAAHPINRDARIKPVNPLAKVPAAKTETGQLLYDSRVICEYLDYRFGGTLFPAPDSGRWEALRLQALADGLLDAALLARYETAVRPQGHQWDAWRDAQMAKIADALDAAARDCAGFAGRVNIGTIALACALGYLDFRFAATPWREARPMLADWYAGFAARRSMIATAPPA